MNRKSIFILLNLLLIIFSCKRENENFNILIDLVYKKDDILKIYYKDGSNEWFDQQHAVMLKIKGSDSIQKINISLPKGVIPNNLRFNISHNSLQSEVKIFKIEIKYINSFFEIDENEIKKYFEPNEFINYNNSAKTFELIKDINGNYDPFLLIKFDFYKEMDRVIRQN